MTHPVERFEGEANASRLLESVKRQQIVDGDEALAAALIDAGKLKGVDEGEAIIKQEGWDDELYLILAGAFEVVINGQRVGIRKPGTHVGERAQLQGGQKRTASIIACEPSVVLELSYEAMTRVKTDHPQIWEAIAKVLDERLAIRDSMLGKANERPMVFIISSAEQLPVAHALQAALNSPDIDVTVWDKGVFNLSDYAMSSLEDAIGLHDFTVAVLGADDSLVTRQKKHKVARDNVHLEYGISVGMLGRIRSLLLVDADAKVKLASDQAGITTLRYQASDIERTVRKAAIEVREHVKKLGPIRNRVTLHPE